MLCIIAVVFLTTIVIGTLSPSPTPRLILSHSTANSLNAAVTPVLATVYFSASPIFS